MVCDLKETDPADWDKDKRPETSPENVIYELHVKEFPGKLPVDLKGKPWKYRAFTEEHTTLHGNGVHPTGLDYLKELGVTHVQIMPAYDYGSVDEKVKQILTGAMIR